MYLEPVEVNALDQIAEAVSLSRSEIMRDLVSFLTTRYAKLIPKRKKPTKDFYKPLNDIIGIASGGDPKAYQKIDTLYYR